MVFARRLDIHADSHSAGSRDQDIQRHQYEPEDGDEHDPLDRFIDFGCHVQSRLIK